MRCSNCGNTLKDGARFCNACGAQIASEPTDAVPSPESGDQESKEQAAPAAALESPPSDTGTVQGTGVPEQASLEGQMQKDKQRGRKKASPWMVLVLALALGTATALAAMFITTQVLNANAPKAEEQTTSSQSSQSSGEEASQASSGEEASKASSTDAAASSQTQAEESLTPEQAALKSIEGWWSGTYHHDVMGYQPAYGNIHDSVIDWYFYDSQAKDIAYSSTVEITAVERFSENGAEGWRFTPSTANRGQFAYYMADGDTNHLPIYETAYGYGQINSSGSNIFSPDRYGISRVTDPASLDANSLAPNQTAMFEKAQALAAERANRESPGSQAQTQQEAAPQVDTTQQARDAAIAAGKQVFDGVIIVQDKETRIQEAGRRVNPSYSNPLCAILQLDAPDTVTGQNPDGATRATEPYRTHDGVTAMLLGMDDAASAWLPYNGQHVTVAATTDDLGFFSDTSGVELGVQAGFRSAEIVATS